MNNGIYLKEMGIKIKTARKARKITLVELAKLCGINITQLSFLENGKSNAHILTLKSIADVFGMEVRDLLS